MQYSAIHPEDRAAVEQSSASMISDQKLIPLEYRILWPDGTVRWVWAEAGELILDEQGRPSLLKGYIQDITARKRPSTRDGTEIVGVESV